MIDKKWDIIIEPKSSIFDLKIKEIRQYKDLLFLFVRRDLVAQYKQTILGPLWYFIQPILTTITFTFIFGNVAGISTEDLPKPLFYLSGITCWRYFSTALTRTSHTFSTNAGLFSKVYFPRAIVPIAATITNLVTFGIQLLLFVAIYLYYQFSEDVVFELQTEIVLFPLLVLIMMMLGLGFGMLLSSMTTKYRDLKNLIAFGIQLLMYCAPVIYPMSAIPSEYSLIILANPMTPIIETFRYMFFGSGLMNYYALLYSLGFAVIIFLIGLLIFNRTEKNFIDTV